MRLNLKSTGKLVVIGELAGSLSIAVACRVKLGKFSYPVTGFRVLLVVIKHVVLKFFRVAEIR